MFLSGTNLSCLRPIPVELLLQLTVLSTAKVPKILISVIQIYLSLTLGKNEVSGEGFCSLLVWWCGASTNFLSEHRSPPNCLWMKHWATAGRVRPKNNRPFYRLLSHITISDLIPSPELEQSKLGHDTGETSSSLSSLTPYLRTQSRKSVLALNMVRRGASPELELKMEFICMMKT